MRVTGFATLPHYRAHIAPILAAIPVESRGALVDHVDGAPDEGPVIVAGFSDLAKLKGPRPIVYVEHGAGQTYVPDGGYVARHPCYSGSTHHLFKRVSLFVCPNATVATRWREVHPATPAVAVGCPRLDRWHPTAGRDSGGPLTVGWTWHWGADIGVKEATSAYPYYRDALPRIVADVRSSGVDVIGHAHPRAHSVFADVWESCGVQWVEDPDRLFESCDLLVADNTSLLYEFASLNRPVVALNAPWYRRRVEHGLRFWSDVPGIQADSPGTVADSIVEALTDPAEVAAARQATIRRVYAHVDGNAAARAAAAICERFG